MTVLTVRLSSAPAKAQAKEPKQTEYERGYVDGTNARNSRKYSTDTVRRFLSANASANASAKNNYTRGYCDGLGGVKHG